MPNPEVIFILSDNIIEVMDVMNVSTGAYINNANVTMTLVDAASGDEIDGQVWPLTLVYVTASNGHYRGTINDDISLFANQLLLAKIMVDGGSGLKRYWEKPCIAQVGD